MNRQMWYPFIFLIVGLGLPLSVMASAQVVHGKTYQSYIAAVENTEYEARVGEPFFIQLSLDPESPPPGYYVSALVEVIDKPDGAKPEILTGFPKVRMTMMQAGPYRIEVRISLVAKSSCGGIDAEEILRQELQLLVADG